MNSNAFRSALEAGDVRQLRRMWSAWFAHLPQPNVKDAEIVMHRARTEAATVTFKARAWSHRWLTECGLPSGLPDRLKPSAERIYPRIAEAVGISVNFRSAWMRPAAVEVRKAMETVVADCYANGDTAPVIVRPRMFEAREKTMRSLFGRS